MELRHRQEEKKPSPRASAGMAYGRRLWAWWVICLPCLLSVLVQAAPFQASLDRNTIGLGEGATLSLMFEGGTPKRPPALQVPKGLTVQSMGQSSQFTMLNGETTSTISYNYLVTASQPGDYVFPPIQVELNGRTFTSTPLRLKVTKGSQPTGIAFLKLIPSKETVYVGEAFPVEIQLFLAAKGDNLQLPQIGGDGFVFGKVPEHPNQSSTQIGNQVYAVVTFRVAAVAVKTGTLTLGPAQCSLVVHVPLNPRSRNLFDDFFGGIQRKPMTLTSDPQTMQVLPLPEANRPSDFNGAVGSFSLAASASPTNVTVGDPITLRVQVVGQGNLEALPFPERTDWAGFKLYPPAGKVETTDPLGLSGAKVFERVVIPERADITELPAIVLRFFDPEQKAYRTIQASSIPISVRPGQATTPQPTVLANPGGAKDTGGEAHDIVHIKPYLGGVIHSQVPLVLRPWFLMLQGLPIAAWICSLLWRKRQELWRNNPRLRRRATVNETIRHGLKELNEKADQQDAEAFFALVFRLLQEQLGERLDMPATAITEAVLEERLAGRVSDELLSEWHELFQLCNQARYARERSSQELRSLLPKIEGALRELRDIPDVR